MAVAAGELRHQITLEQREEVDDGYGNTVGEWVPKGTVFAKFHYLRGGEEVMAARLVGTQPAIITVRFGSLTKQVRPDWRIVDSNGVAWNIRAITDTDSRRAYLDILAERGVAT